MKKTRSPTIPPGRQLAASVGSKTIDDVTRPEWQAFLLAALQVLAYARLHFWLDGSPAEEAKPINSMCRALAVMGLPMPSTPKFESDIEHRMKSAIARHQKREKHYREHTEKVKRS